MSDPYYGNPQRNARMAREIRAVADQLRESVGIGDVDRTVLDAAVELERIAEELDR